MTQDYTTEEVDLNDKFKELALIPPDGLAIFPENFLEVSQVSDFLFAEPATQVNKIFRFNQIPAEVLGGKLGPLKSRKSGDVFLPAIYIGAGLLSENSTLVTIALNVISNYVTDMLKGSFGEPKVSIEIYTETKGKKKTQRISYKGGVEGIKGLSEVIKKLDK